jgi:hypothetical protein
MPPEVEAVMALAPAPVREAFDVFERVSDRVLAQTGKRPSPSAAQRLLLAGMARAGGTDDDLRFLIVHELADDDDLAYWRERFPHATRRAA